MNSQDKLIKQLTTPAYSGFFNYNNLKLHYVKAGKGKPLILIHGATIGWGQWVLNIDQLAKFFTVYAIDLPGAGLSTKVNFHKHRFKEIFIDPLINFIGYHNLKNSIIIGHSTGGFIAGHLVTGLSQVKGAILINPVGFGKKTPIPFRLLSLPGFASFLTRVLIGKSKNKLKNFLSEALYIKDSMTDSFVNYVFESSKLKGWLGPLHLISTMTSLFGIKDKFMMLDLIEDNDKKIILIWGQYDTTFDREEVKKNIKSISNISMITLENTGHVPNIEQSEKFNKLILRLLKDQLWK